MRTLTTNAATKANTAQATEPMIILQIDWGGSIGTKYYAERYYVLGSITANAAILDIGQLNSTVRQNNVGMMTTMTFKLDDTSGQLKLAYDTAVIERKNAVVYQHFDGNAESDKVTLFNGCITSPVYWDEGQRTLSITIESKYLQAEIGYAPDFASQSIADHTVGLDESCIGRPWPFVIGTAFKVPAVRVGKAPETIIVAQSGLASFLLDDVTNWPAGGLVDVEGVVFAGTRSGNVFNITGINMPKFPNLGIGGRDSSDADKDNPAVFWLSSYASIIGQCVHFNSTSGGSTFADINTYDPLTGAPTTMQHVAVYRVTQQKGKKIFVDRPIYASSGDEAFLSSGKIVFVSKEPQPGYPSPFSSQNNRGFIVNREEGTVLNYTWNYGCGTRIKMLQISDVYVANCRLPSTTAGGGGISTVYGVYARRKGILQLVPSGYYTVISGTLSPFGVACTSLTFPTPLEQYVDQGWDGSQIYVTLQGALSNDPVTCISQIISSYTALTPDSTTFAAAAGKGLGKCNFAFFNVRNALKLAEEIAFHNGLALLVEGNSVKITQLYLEPSSVFTVSEAKVKAGTLMMGLSDMNDVYTRVTGTYKQDYCTRTWTATLLQNTAVFGVLRESIDFESFQTYEEAYKSMFFWLNRRSNVWKTIKFTTVMPGILLEVFDCITLAFTDTTLVAVTAVAGAIKAVVSQVSYNPKTKEIQIEATLPYVAGNLIRNGNYWVDGVSFPAPVYPSFGALVGVDALIVEKMDPEQLVDAQIGLQSSLPAIITQNLGNGQYTVDTYGDGFNNGSVPFTPTMQSVPAVLTDDRASPKPGDPVTVNFSNGKALIQSSGAGTAGMIARLTGELSPGVYGFVEYDPVLQVDKLGGALGNAEELNTSTGISNNTIVLLIASGTSWFFFFPVATCS